MPWIDLEGAVNVRDVGGLPAGDGLAAIVSGQPAQVAHVDGAFEINPRHDTSLADPPWACGLGKWVRR